MKRSVVKIWPSNRTPILENTMSETSESAPTSQLPTGGGSPDQNAPADTSNAQPASGSAKEAVKQEIRRYKLKVNGQEREVDEKMAIALAQKGLAADEKFQRSAAKAKEVESLFKLAKQDPDRFIKEVLGEDAVEFAKKRLSKELEELSLDPKEKELREYRRKLEAYQAKEKAEQERAKQEASDKAVAHWTQHYDKVLPEAIKSAGLPLTEDVIRHATDIMIANLEEGFDLPMEAVMELTKDRYLGSVRKFLGNIDPGKAAEILGDELAVKLGLMKAKPSTKAPFGKAAVQSDSNPIEKRAPKSEREAKAELEERIRRWAAGE